MLFLLRKIRRKLIQTLPAGKAGNKVTTYLLYGIGEIILVVIGILIAVNIDDWNGERKDKIRSEVYLTRLNDDINLVIDDLGNSVAFLERNLKSSITVKESLETQKLDPSAQQDFERYLSRYYQFILTIQDVNTFNEMLSAGELSLIPSRWIREAFAELADDRDFILEVSRANHNATIFNHEAFEKYIRYNFEYLDGDSALVTTTYDFDAMAKDPSFINKISRQSKVWYEITDMFKEFEQDAYQLKDSIQFELKEINTNTQ